MTDLQNTHKVATVFTEEMKKDRDLFLLTIKELVNKVDKENTITCLLYTSDAADE